LGALPKRVDLGMVATANSRLGGGLPAISLDWATAIRLEALRVPQVDWRRLTCIDYAVPGLRSQRISGSQRRLDHGAKPLCIVSCADFLLTADLRHQQAHSKASRIPVRDKRNCLDYAAPPCESVDRVVLYLQALVRLWSQLAGAGLQALGPLVWFVRLSGSLN